MANDPNADDLAKKLVAAGFPASDPGPAPAPAAPPQDDFSPAAMARMQQEGAVLGGAADLAKASNRPEVGAASTLHQLTGLGQANSMPPAPAAAAAPPIAGGAPIFAQPAAAPQVIPAHEVAMVDPARQAEMARLEAERRQGMAHQAQAAQMGLEGRAALQSQRADDLQHEADDLRTGAALRGFESKGDRDELRRLSKEVAGTQFHAEENGATVPLALLSVLGLIPGAIGASARGVAGMWNDQRNKDADRQMDAKRMSAIMKEHGASELRALLEAQGQEADRAGRERGEVRGVEEKRMASQLEAAGFPAEKARLTADEEVRETESKEKAARESAAMNRWTPAGVAGVGIPGQKLTEAQKTQLASDEFNRQMDALAQSPLLDKIGIGTAVGSYLPQRLAPDSNLTAQNLEAMNTQVLNAIGATARDAEGKPNKAMLDLYEKRFRIEPGDTKEIALAKIQGARQVVNALARREGAAAPAPTAAPVPKTPIQ